MLDLIAAPPPVALAPRRPLPTLLQAAQAAQYAQMETTFRRHGGIAGAEEVTGMLGRHIDQPISRLARWIVQREVISFQWRARTLLPLFQFVPGTMDLRAPVSKALLELAPVLDDWELAWWFARPNAWLGDAAPVDRLAGQPDAVFDAARADRYLQR